jgi:DNA-directed RNA polymerase subunit RPC12/RpoP
MTFRIDRMTIEFRCDQCSKLLRTTDDKAGATAKCPQCGAPVTVPAPSQRPLDEPYDDEIPTAPRDPGMPGPAARPRGEAGPWPFGDQGELDRPSSSRPARPSSRGGSERACPMCGEGVSASATRCPHCGERLAARAAARAAASMRPHRGGLILAFGILGFFCFVFALLALIMGNDDLKEMQAGRMDPSGEGLTQAGRILGVIDCVLVALLMMLACLVISLAAVN